MKGTVKWAPAIVRPESLVMDRRLMLLLTGMSDDGGAELQTAQLAVWMHRRGWKVTVVSMMTPRRLPAEMADHRIAVESLEMTPGKMDLRGVLRLRNLLKRDDPHVLHAHMTHASLLARAVRVIRRVPVLICTLHGARMYTVRGDGWRTREMLHRLTDPLADITTAVSGEAARHYASSRAVSAERLRVVPNGVDTRRFCPDEQARRTVRGELGLGNEFAWLAAGRFDAVKDHATLLDAFGRLVQRAPEQVLLLAGDGPLRADLERRAAAFAERVRFLGHRRDIDSLMNCADGFVLSSRFEGLPLALIEASSSGLPVVATRTGGNAEVVVDGFTGLLVEAGDAEALAGAMESIVRRPEGERRWLGLAGRRHVLARYSLDTVMAGWERIYERLLARNVRSL